MKYFQTLHVVLRIPRTYVYMLATTLVVYLLTVILSQGANMWNIFTLDAPLFSRLFAIMSFFTSISYTFSYQSFFIMLITACVVGLQFSLVRLYAKDKLYLAHNKLNIVGIIATLLGCLACCGSIIFSIISSLIGISIQSVLPFAGIEFSYLGLLIACLACFVTLRRYHRPQVC
jgi:hypothetical protein